MFILPANLLIMRTMLCVLCLGVIARKASSVLIFYFNFDKVTSLVV
jgi:hypothetical protein